MTGYISPKNYSTPFKEIFLRLLAMHSSQLSDGIGVGTVSNEGVIQVEKSLKTTFYEALIERRNIMSNVANSCVVLLKQRKNTSGNLKCIQPLQCSFKGKDKKVLLSLEGTIVGYEDKKARNDVHAVARVIAGDKSLKAFINSSVGDCAISFYEDTEHALKVFIKNNELNEPSVNVFLLEVGEEIFISTDRQAISLLSKIVYDHDSPSLVQKLKGNLLYTITPGKVISQELNDSSKENLRLISPKEKIHNHLLNKIQMKYKDHKNFVVHTQCTVVDDQVYYSSNYLWTESGTELILVDGKFYTNNSANLQYYRGKVVEAYFYNGLLIKSKEAFEKLVKERGQNCSSINILNKYVKYPIDPRDFNTDNTNYFCPGPKRKKLFSGVLKPIFTNQEIFFEEGKISQIKSNNQHNKVPNEFYYSLSTKKEKKETSLEV